MKQAFAEKFKEHPELRLDIVKMIEEQNVVAVYLKNVNRSGKTICRVVDIYRLEDGMLAGEGFSVAARRTDICQHNAKLIEKSKFETL